MDDTHKTIPVFSGSLVKVEKLKHDLEAIGIEVMVKNFDATASLTGFANITRATMQLSILETEIENARPVVERFKKRFNL